MTSIYIMILAISLSTGSAVTTAEFGDKQACEAAIQAFIKVNPYARTYGICVLKETHK